MWPRERELYILHNSHVLPILQVRHTHHEVISWLSLDCASGDISAFRDSVHHQHRYRSLLQHFPGRATQYPFTQPGVAVTTHHQQIGANGFG